MIDPRVQVRSIFGSFSLYIGTALNELSQELKTHPKVENAGQTFSTTEFLPQHYGIRWLNQ
jgi:TfoX/Sxy family transcriptional regulator of competence genes